MGIVVLEGTAFKEILTLLDRLDLEQIIFIMCITPFSGDRYNIIIHFKVVFIVGVHKFITSLKQIRQGFK